MAEALGIDAPMAPAGGAFSTLSDMLLYAEALVGGGANRNGRVLAEATLASMFEPHHRLGGRVGWQGWCFFLGNENGHPTVYHHGDLAGFEAGLMVAPDDGVGAVALSNRNARGAPQRLSLQLVRLALQLPVERETAARPTRDAAAQLTGDYHAAVGPTSNLRGFLMTGGQLHVSYQKGQLVMRGRLPGMLRSALRLNPVPGDDPLFFRVRLRGFPYDDSDMEVVFARNGFGRVDHLELGLLGSRFERVAARS